jgi:prepilin-type N-terminal cleavage/methylation domain-containing protein
MYFKNNKGFTLVELIVVMSIISLLSSIVLVNLNGYFTRAKDAAIKQEASQLALLMTQNYTDYGTYCNLQWWWVSASGYNCTNINLFSGTYAPKAREICNSIFNNAGENNWGAPGGYKIYSNTYSPTSSFDCNTAYSFMIFLNDGNWYCFGSSGAKGEYAYYGDPPNSNPGCYANP